jgi:hypothetical protein
MDPAGSPPEALPVESDTGPDAPSALEPEPSLTAPLVDASADSIETAPLAPSSELPL